MEAVGPESCRGIAVSGAEGRPALVERVHFRVTRFIMEAGNRCPGEAWAEAGMPSSGLGRLPSRPA